MRLGRLLGGCSLIRAPLVPALPRLGGAERGFVLIILHVGVLGKVRLKIV
jgi:hypothetical protein